MKQEQQRKSLVGSSKEAEQQTIAPIPLQKREGWWRLQGGVEMIQLVVRFLMVAQCYIPKEEDNQQLQHHHSGEDWWRLQGGVGLIQLVVRFLMVQQCYILEEEEEEDNQQL